jgi:hypothetical protein
VVLYKSTRARRWEGATGVSLARTVDGRAVASKAVRAAAVTAAAAVRTELGLPRLSNRRPEPARGKKWR